ncbi:MAG: Gar1/Naf1 family protein [Candidatus Methanomethylicaceae archaeon]
MRSSHNDVLSEIGQVLSISKSNLILARIKIPPKLGSFVYLKDGRKLGIIIDIFGPVANPYALIKPSRNLNKDEIIGIPIFLKKLGGKKNDRRFSN